MPLPQFLLMLAAVIVAAAVTIFVALVAGLPPAFLGLFALLIAAAVHLLRRDPDAPRRNDPRHRTHHHNGN